MSNETASRNGQRVAAFLNDEAVKGAIESLGQKLYREFKDATTDEAQRRAWARARALDEVLAELRIVVDRGVHAQAQIAREEKEMQQRQQRKR